MRFDFYTHKPDNNQRLASNENIELINPSGQPPHLDPLATQAIAQIPSPTPQNQTRQDSQDPGGATPRSGRYEPAPSNIRQQILAKYLNQ